MSDGNGQKKDPVHLDDQFLQQLRLQEYIALRAEQRTRLDGANRIIQYYVAIIAGIATGFIALFRTSASTQLGTATQASSTTADYQYIVGLIFLCIPALTMPFALTQHNEELFVLRIGKYLEKCKEDISEKGDGRYWNWEEFHYSETTLAFTISGIFRSGLLLLFALSSFLAGVLCFRVPRPHCTPTELHVRLTLIVVDAVLILCGFTTSYYLARRRRGRVKMESKGVSSPEVPISQTLADPLPPSAVEVP